MIAVVYFFGGWDPIVRIVVVGTLTYLALVAILRISGSRTLASMNAFDFIVSVAIGAAFGRTLTAREVAVAEAVAALALLVGLQYGIAWVQTRWPRVRGALTTAPALLYFRGTFLREAMRRERVTEEELLGVVRKEKLGSLADVEAVVLESSGEFSVIKSVGDGSALGEAIQKQIAEGDSNARIERERGPSA